MKTWTVHTKAGHGPILQCEGFSFGALLFGPLWLLGHRAWIAAVLLGCAQGASVLLAGPFGGAVIAGLAWAGGVFGGDLVRWSLDRRGYVLSDVVAASSYDLAFGRILTARPGLIDGLPA